MLDDSTKLNFHRQLDFYNPARDANPPVTIIGAGGIGSFVAPALATLGLNDIEIWDADVVEGHNVPNQNFELAHVGMKKVDAVADTIRRKTGLEIKTRSEFFYDDSIVRHDGIVIAATDSIKSRSDIFKSLTTKSRSVSRFVDGRLGGEMFRVFNIDMHNDEDVEFYKSTLFEPSEAVALPCTARAVIYIANEICATMVRQVKMSLTSNNTKISREIFVDHVGGSYEFDDKMFSYFR